VSTESVAFSPKCAECHQVWLPRDKDRWHAYWVDDGPVEQLVFYCPECAEREFGDD
jgi:ribosomal protein S27AE